MARISKNKKEYIIKQPPVVTMLGHVDHGKTSILDAIRGTKVQSCEAGGITQSVRAHQITHKTKNNEEYKITFIDTPGHKAFSQMRSRGAKVTDIVVLVVAANDGVQPQTIEAIEFAHESKVPIIVALNKIDLKDTNKSKAIRELSDNGVQVEKLGGDIICIETSAKTQKGLDELLDAILLTAEINITKETKPTKGKAEAVVIESTTDKSLGIISFCLIKSGNINTRDFALWDNNQSRIRAFKDENFCNKKTASTSEPVWITGFDEEIPIGETIHFYEKAEDIKKENKDEKPKQKKEPKETTKENEDTEELDEDTLVKLLGENDKNDFTELKIILKSESQGTLEAAIKELKKLSTNEVKIKIINSSTGDISEDDIFKAKDSDGIVIGFKSYLPKKNAKIARIEKVLVRNYEIIYELLEEIAEVLESMKDPEEKEVEVARTKIKKVFELSDGTKIAGCEVINGTVVKGYQCFVERPSLKKDNRLGESKIVSLRNKKEEVRESEKNTECGIQLDPEINIEKNDEIVCFKIEKS